MDTNLIAAMISASIAGIGLLFGYWQWRRDVKIKLGQLREAVSVELIHQRVEPYAHFMQKLEIASTLRAEELKQDPINAMSVLQEAVYGKVGLLASHTTRQVLLYVRQGIKEFSEGEISYGELIARCWSLHFALRSDLGISQPQWPNEVERIHNAATKDDNNAFEKLLKFYPWNQVDLALRNPRHDVYLTQTKRDPTQSDQSEKASS